MRKLKTFPVTEIVTMPDGRVILNGPLGSLDVYRSQSEYCTGSSVSRYRTQFEWIEEDKSTHTIKITEIPQPGTASVISAGIGF